MKTPGLDALIEKMPRSSRERFALERLRGALLEMVAAGESAGKEDFNPFAILARNALKDAEERAAKPS